MGTRQMAVGCVLGLARRLLVYLFFDFQVMTAAIATRSSNSSKARRYILKTYNTHIQHQELISSSSMANMAQLEAQNDQSCKWTWSNGRIRRDGTLSQPPQP